MFGFSFVFANADFWKSYSVSAFCVFSYFKQCVFEYNDEASRQASLLYTVKSRTHAPWQSDQYFCTTPGHRRVSSAYRMSTQHKSLNHTKANRQQRGPRRLFLARGKCKSLCGLWRPKERAESNWICRRRILSKQSSANNLHIWMFCAGLKWKLLMDSKSAYEPSWLVADAVSMCYMDYKFELKLNWFHVFEWWVCLCLICCFGGIAPSS